MKSKITFALVMMMIIAIPMFAQAPAAEDAPRDLARWFPPLQWR